ncbi:hypothetical protein P43SY_004502 [Pythium insidiosum]|uniref:Uncharacterized protein n=1 Tax=Pythium insidiosum TaxID=114742 RepID=A0AAD5LH21_PYTIN|nr:hypothetical protein P43SY_004502 [Pythium insidiosum]
MAPMRLYFSPSELDEAQRLAQGIVDQQTQRITDAMAAGSACDQATVVEHAQKISAQAVWALGCISTGTKTMTEAITAAVEAAAGERSPGNPERAQGRMESMLGQLGLPLAIKRLDAPDDVVGDADLAIVDPARDDAIRAVSEIQTNLELGEGIAKLIIAEIRRPQPSTRFALLDILTDLDQSWTFSYLAHKPSESKPALARRYASSPDEALKTLQQLFSSSLEE